MTPARWLATVTVVAVVCWLLGIISGWLLGVAHGVDTADRRADRAALADLRLERLAQLTHPVDPIEEAVRYARLELDRIGTVPDEWEDQT